MDICQRDGTRKMDVWFAFITSLIFI